MTTVVIGVGNPDRGDDGVGWRVVDLLDGALATRRSSGDPATLIDLWSGFERALLVDATCTGAEPGTISWGDPGMGAHAASAAGTHGLGVLEAIDLARAMETLPRELIVIGIEGSRFGHGTVITPEVAAAAEHVAAHIAYGV